VRICEIRGMTCMIGLGRPCIGVITCQIGTRTCHIGDGQYDLHTKFSQLPVSHDDFPPSPVISLSLVLNSTITEEHEAKSALSISLCNDQELILNTAYTEYCIHCVLHHPKIDCLPLPASLSSLSRPWCPQFSTFPHL